MAYRSSFRHVLAEFSGIIEAVGSEVRDFAVGDEIFGLVPERNSHVEMIVTEAENYIATKPPSLSFEAGASIASGGVTALIALEHLKPDTGDTLIVHGASGNVGNHVVQLAKERGVKSIVGTASPENLDYVRSLGAVAVPYGQGLKERLHAAVEQGAKVKIVDTYGREALSASIDLVTDRARDVMTMQPFMDEEFGVTFCMIRYERDLIREVSARYADGSIVAREPVVFPVDSAADAHRLVETKNSRGKVVLRIG